MELAKTNPVGRPSKYNPTILRKTKEYINNYKEEGDKIPSIAGLAVKLTLSRDTIYYWLQQKDKEEFSDIVSQLMTKQEAVLLNGGIDGSFNSQICKTLLSKHGYHDKQEIDVNQEVNITGDNELARRMAYVIAQSASRVIEHED